MTTNKSSYLDEEFNPPLSERRPLEWDEFGMVIMRPMSDVEVGRSFEYAKMRWTKISPDSEGNNAFSAIMGMTRKMRVDPHMRVLVRRYVR